jgi:hypothetical protein
MQDVGMLDDGDVRLMQGLDQLTFGEPPIAEQVDPDWKRPGEFDGQVRHRTAEGDPRAAAAVDDGGPGESVRVPLLKFGGNRGKLVLPAEAEDALLHADAQLLGHPHDVDKLGKRQAMPVELHDHIG